MKKIIAVTAVFIMLFSVGNVSASAAAKVAALMYHSVTEDSSRWDDYTISPAQLDADIQYFKSCGYILMTATELATANMNDINDRKILLLTFDDGYSNFYTEIFPILKKNDAKATMFLIGSYIDRYGYLTSDETYEMANSGLVEIGNHTNSIHSMPKEQLKSIYGNSNAFGDILGDIQSNEEILEAVTGKDVTSLSWPYGYYTTTLDNAIKNQLGYKISFSTEYGVNFFTGNTYNPLKRMNREYSAETQQVFDRANGKF